MIIFGNNRGAVVRMSDPTAQASVAFVGIKGAGISFTAQRAIITRMTLSQEANVQFMHTVGEKIFIYAFGDRMGQIGLSGLAFAKSCGGVTHGIVGMLGWYRQWRAPNRGAPLRVALDTEVIEGFLVGSSFDSVDAESGLVQWNMILRSLPET